MDTGITQGRVLSRPLFNLLVNSLAADNRRCCPGVRLVPTSNIRFVCQLCADDVAVLAESAEDLQRGLDAVTSWGRTWSFTFGVSPGKWAVIIFLEPSRRTLSCSVTLSNLELPVVRTCRSIPWRHFDAFALVDCPHQPSHHSRPQNVCKEYNVVTQRRSPRLLRTFLDQYLRASERSVRIVVCG